MRKQIAQNTETYSRRRILQFSGCVTVAALFTPWLLTGCSSDTQSEPLTIAVADTTNCSAATDPMINEQRKAVQYLVPSPHTDKQCTNCRFFKRDSSKIDCGGCEIVGGSIAFDGFCSVWAEKAPS